MHLPEDFTGSPRRQQNAISAEPAESPPTRDVSPCPVPTGRKVRIADNRSAEDTPSVSVVTFAVYRIQVAVQG
jgi:hypothetical protein